MNAVKRTIQVIVLTAAVLTGMSGCNKKKNGSAGTTAATPASQCVLQSDGVYRDQYNRVCTPTTSTTNCLNTRYDHSTGRYVDLTTGAVVNCNPTGYFDGYNSIPYYGYNNGQQINGCSGWTSVLYQQYGYVQYVPVDIGNGQLICMNTQYLGYYNPGYNWNTYAQYQYPIYTCNSYDCGNLGGSYYGQQYSCNMGFQFGFFTFGFGGGVGGCLY